MQSGARDTAVSFSSKLAVLAISVAVQSTLAWMLGPDGRGSYAVCLLFSMVLAVVFTFGVDRAGQYFAASRKIPVERAVTGTLVALGVGAALAVILGYLLTRTGLAFLEKAEPSSFLLALAVIPIVTFHNALVLLLVGLRRIGWMAVVTIVNVAVQLAAALVLVWALGLGVNGALGAVIAAGLVSTAISLVYLRRSGALARCRATGSDYRALVSYGLRYLVAKFSNIFYFRVGTIVLAFFVDPAGIGLFAAASTLISRVVLLPEALETALFPRIAGDERGRPELVAQSARATALVVGPGLVLLVALSGPIVRILLSPSFLPSLPLIWIIAPGIFFRATSKVLVPYFMGTDRPAVCSWAVGIGTVVNVACVFLLLPLVGLSGAAWAMTVGNLASSLILVVAFHRVTGSGFAETWLPGRADVALLVDTVRGLGSRARSRN